MVGSLSHPGIITASAAVSVRGTGRADPFPVTHDDRPGGGVGTAETGLVAPVVDARAAGHLVRAAGALRWKRPDLTATLAELALDSAPDAATWIAAGGWLLHGVAVVGDGRDTACDLLDGLGRWGEMGAVLMRGPVGGRLRVELAGHARRIGEPVLARALLPTHTVVDEGDAELRADVLTEQARGTAGDAPAGADEALRTAEEAWRSAACPPGVASVLLLGAARQRQRGTVDAAVARATAGLSCLDVGGRRAGDTASGHVAAALTAEWIAALLTAGRLDEVRGEALPVAHRLIRTAGVSRQVAGLRLALARVGAVTGGPAAVLTELEAAADDAAGSDVPELEAACRTMLGELHEGAGRLDAALAAVRAAMAAERRDHDRTSRLRLRLTAAAATWADADVARDVASRSAGPPAHASERVAAAGPVPAGPPDDARDAGHRPRRPGAHAGSPGPAAGAPQAAVAASRRARRLAAEARATGPDSPATGSDDAVAEYRGTAGPALATLPPVAGDPDLPHRTAAWDTVPDLAPEPRTGRRPTSSPTLEVPATPRRAASPERADAVLGPAAAPGSPADGGSLIGDALLRELAEAGPDVVPRAPTRLVEGPSTDGPPPRPGSWPGTDGRSGTTALDRPVRDRHAAADASLDMGAPRDDDPGGDGSPPAGSTAPVVPAPPAEADVADAETVAVRRPAASPRTAGPPGRETDGRETDGRETDGMGLAELLAGALAAYRNL